MEIIVSYDGRRKDKRSIVAPFVSCGEKDNSMTDNKKDGKGGKEVNVRKE
jgi:hypothetical protein